MNRYTVWIDHQNAHILKYSVSGAKRLEVQVEHETPTKEHLRKFYHAVALKMQDADHVLVLGPGQAKEEFRNHCEDHHREIAAAIFQVETMKDHPSESELLRTSKRLYERHFNWEETI